MSPARRLADWLMVVAERLMPAHRIEWARAMTAEQAHIGDLRSALAFSAGCIGAAGRERLRALAPDESWFWPGVVVGLLLAASAAIPGSRSWPLLWAPIGGFLTVLTLDRERLAFGRAVALALKAGLLSALLFYLSGLMLDTPSEAMSPQVPSLAIAVAIIVAIAGAAAAPLVCDPPGARAPNSKEEH